MKCNICGGNDAKVRECEIDVAAITSRAHIDCNGHSEYRHLSFEEFAQIQTDAKEKQRLETWITFSKQ